MGMSSLKTSFAGCDAWIIRPQKTGRFTLPPDMPDEYLNARRLLVTQNNLRPALTIMDAERFLAQPIPDEDYILYYPFSDILHWNEKHEIKLKPEFMARVNPASTPQDLVLVDIKTSARHYCLMCPVVSLDTPGKIKDFARLERMLVETPEYFCVL